MIDIQMDDGYTPEIREMLEGRKSRALSGLSAVVAQ
jgi:hypothetical protein